MVQSSCSVKNGKLNETIEVSALRSILDVGLFEIPCALDSTGCY